MQKINYAHNSAWKISNYAKNRLQDISGTKNRNDTKISRH